MYGGGEALTNSRDNGVVPRPPVSAYVLASSSKEMGYLEWFRCRTAVKLPGSFATGFWKTLLFQATLDEPAVLHAVLAISSVHKRGTLAAENHSEPDDIACEQEHFTAQQFVKATHHLQPHFVTRDKASFRVALITCALFVCLEMLRGHFKTAQMLLDNGAKILREMQMLSIGDNGIHCLKSCSDPIDESIVEAFSRLYLQEELFRYAYRHPRPILPISRFGSPVSVFRSINETWQHLERLLSRIFNLTHQSRKLVIVRGAGIQDNPALLVHQQDIRTELIQWLRVFEVYQKPLQGRRSAEEEKCYHLLCAYHTMASIMADTCLAPNDEMSYDAYTSQFIVLIEQLAHLWTVASITSHVQVPPGHAVNMSWSIIDMGWMPPLYCVATKCRVHRIRLQAIRLLESTFHREGIWDAKTTACVSRKVMQLEERGYYEGLAATDDFPLVSSPSLQDLSLPTLPRSYRIREIEVVLSDAPMNDMMLFCKQKHADVDCRVLLSTYDTRLQNWIDNEVYRAT